MSDSSRSAAHRAAPHLLWLIPALVLIAVVAVPGFSFSDSSGAVAPPPDPSQASILGVTRESDGPVTVALTPKELSDGGLTVEMAVNTHTVNDLHTYDLTHIVTLKVDGKTIPPVSAPELEGHHGGGDLVFPLETMPDALTIEIRGLNGVELRTFTWP